VAAIESDNVAALLPAADPALAREHVVLTAHFDHVGTGAPTARRTTCSSRSTSAPR
jgi:hypothetical protein